MYFYSKTEQELIQITEEKDGGWAYRKKRIKPTSINNSLISVVEPEKYNYWIDRVLNSMPVPDFIPKKGLQKPEVGKNYIVGNQVMRLEHIIPNRCIIFSILKGEREGYSELSEEEVEYLGIDYKEGLITLSPTLKLREYDPDKIEYNPKDLGTYPKSTLEGLNSEIHYIILSLSGFKRTEDKNIIETPNGDLIEAECFLVTMKIILQQNISPVGESTGYTKGDVLEFTCITEPFKGSPRIEKGDFIDTNGKIYLIVRLSNNGHGVSSLSLRGISPEELFKVSWDSAFSLNNREKDFVYQRINFLPDYNYQIFRKENSGFLFRKTKNKSQYIKLIEK